MQTSHTKRTTWFSSLARFHQAKTLGEFWQLVTWEDIDRVSVFPSLIVLTMPIFYLIFNSLPGYRWSYEDLGDWIFQMCTYTGILAILLIAAKWFTDRSSLKIYSRQNIISAGCFLAFFLLIFISTDVNGVSYYAYTGYSFHHETLVTYAGYVLFFLFPAGCIRTPKVKHFVICYAILTSMALGIAVLIDAFLIEIYPLRIAWAGGYSAVFYNPNHYGYYLSFTILLSAGAAAWSERLAWRIIGWISYAVQLVVLILNNTLGSYLAVFAGMILVCIMERIVRQKLSRRTILLFCSFFVISILVTLFNADILNSILEFGFDIRRLFGDDPDKLNAGTGRAILWYYTLIYISEKPLLGYGVEGIADRLSRDCELTRPHNVYMEFAAFFGVPAALCFITGIFHNFLNGLKQKLSLDIDTMTALAATFSFAFSALFGISIFYTTPYFFMLIGLSFTILPKQAEKGSAEPASGADQE